MSRRFSIAVGEGDKVTATTYRAAASVRARATPPVLILGHGAGAPQTHPFMIAMGAGLASRGVTVVTFDFVYMEKGKKLPDKPGRLESCWRAVLCRVRSREKNAKILIGGKSMGGRIASQIAPGEPNLAGLVFLGYPLHPPGNPAALRAAHLPNVQAPMLFVQGENDAFGTPTELAPIVAPLRARVFVVPAADHSFQVPKRGAVSQEDVMTRMQDEVARFVFEVACA